jgi:hypothetical protein
LIRFYGDGINYVIANKAVSHKNSINDRPKDMTTGFFFRYIVVGLAVIVNHWLVLVNFKGDKKLLCMSISLYCRH